MKPTKKFISLALALIMCLSLLPMTAMAAAPMPTHQTIASGREDSLAIKTDGTLWQWSKGSAGTPEKVMDDVVSIHASRMTYYAVKSNGELWGWGENLHFLSGVSDGNISAPTKIMDNVVNVSAGGDYTYAVQSDSSLWVWGRDYYAGSGGWNSGDTVSAPIKIMTDVAMVAAVKSPGFLYMKSDGSVWGVYGPSSSFNNSASSPENPEKIMDSAKSLASGVETSSWPLAAFIIDSNNALWGWGSPVGNGGRKYLDSVMYANHIAAVTTGGDLYFVNYAGYRGLDGLGIPGTIDPSNPSKVMGGVAAYADRLILMQDGTLLTFDDYAKAFTTILTDVKLPSGGTTATPTQPTTPTVPVTTPTAPAQSGKTVNPTASKVFVNGAEKSFEAYNIDGSNYFKLRDVAFVLNGTSKPFEVGYDNATKAITMTSGQPYTPTGGEMAAGDGQAKPATPTASKIYLDGTELSFTVYNIGGSNFFKLVDLMSALNIGVTYNETTRNISIDTNVDHTGVVTVSTPDAPVSTPTQTSPTQQPTAIKEDSGLYCTLAVSNEDGKFEKISYCFIEILPSWEGDTTLTETDITDLTVYVDGVPNEVTFSDFHEAFLAQNYIDERGTVKVYRITLNKDFTQYPATYNLSLNVKGKEITKEQTPSNIISADGSSEMVDPQQ